MDEPTKYIPIAAESCYSYFIELSEQYLRTFKAHIVGLRLFNFMFFVMLLHVRFISDSAIIATVFYKNEI